jgi:hypothetical protein
LKIQATIPSYASQGDSLDEGNWKTTIVLRQIENSKKKKEKGAAMRYPLAG